MQYVTVTNVLLAVIAYCVLEIWFLLRRKASIPLQNGIPLYALYVVETQSLMEPGAHLLYGGNDFGYSIARLYDWGSRKDARWVGNSLQWKSQDRETLVGEVKYEAFKDLVAAQIAFERATKECAIGYVAGVAYLRAITGLLEPIDADLLASACSEGYLLRYSAVVVVPKYRKEKAFA